MDIRISTPSGGTNGLEIAVIGMSYRFPGASNSDQFWTNLCEGVESVSFFSDQELESFGAISRDLFDHPQYVKAGAVLEGVELFDAGFFGYSPRDAAILDPQQRLFLECAWEALEDAGYDSESYRGSIGVYAGASMSSYLINCVSDHFHDALDPLQVVLGNDKDYLATRVSYKLNLEGPSVAVQSACSTALVAIHLACQALLSGECDIAMSGAASIRIPQKTGYFSSKGGILSPDGHCRVFDARAQGTVRGNGVGLVVLKRLSDALADGDTIHAVIKGSAVNNDGAKKVGFTAPRADGQAKVIRAAHFMANVEPETITFLEAHGTGTELGDPIEVEALSGVFGSRTDKKHFCAIGSVKSNIGHLDATAGLAGFIKTVLALKHRRLPPTVNFERPNPKIDFESSPFYVNTQLLEWHPDATPRRAATSSFGMGGTNAHVILEEAPEAEPESPSRPWQLLVLSAKTSNALDQSTARLGDYLEKHELCIADVAHTLHNGRRAFDYRRAIVCKDRQDAVEVLGSLDPLRVMDGHAEACERKIVFMFSGQGAQYPQMAHDLYCAEPTFRKHIDRCSELLKAQMGIDIRETLYPLEGKLDQAARSLMQTSITQPALFVTEYALAKLMIEWGLRPAAMIGHSIGEYAAACLADVFSLEEALKLVATRGSLMQQLPPGAMLSVKLSENELRTILNPQLALAAVNGPSYCVVSGTTEAIEDFERRLADRGSKYQRLHTSHAFHSPMMEPILEAFADEVAKLELKPPQTPFVSNLTGDWITDSQATDPRYWASHLRNTVRFSDGVSQLLKTPNQVLLEIGPGDTLAGLARQHLAHNEGPIVLTSMRHVRVTQPDTQYLLTTLGKLWLAGVKVDWSGFYSHERRRRVPLPTYSFERQRYWLDPKEKSSPSIVAQAAAAEKTDAGQLLYVPTWKESILAGAAESAPNLEQGSRVLVFLDSARLGSGLINRLELSGVDVISVIAANRFDQINRRLYSIDPEKQADYDELVGELLGGKKAASIIHLWNIGTEPTASPDESVTRSQLLGFYSLLFLAQALGKRAGSTAVQVRVVTDSLQGIRSEPIRDPERASLLGPIRCIPQEYDKVSCQAIDIVLSAKSTLDDYLIDHLLREFSTEIVDPVVAYRRGQRWVPSFEPVAAATGNSLASRLRQKGTYLITGGLGGVGLELARYLARTVQANLVLTSRSGVPTRDDWDPPLENPTDHEDQSEIVRLLESFEELKSEVMVIAADVTDRRQMEAAIEQATARFGQIHGVIHAAGVPGGGVIQLKTAEKAGAVLAPKLTGTLVLDELFEHTNLDFLVLCSSISAIQPQLGQADYCGANAFLDAYAHHATQRGAFTVAINWDRWNEVGMAVKAEARLPKRRSGQDGEVDHPMVDRCLVNEPDQQIYETELTVARHWFLDEHRIVKRPTLPGTALLELARAVFESRFPGASIEMKEITFLSPLVFEDHESKSVLTIVNKSAGASPYDVRFLSRSARANGSGAQEQELARLKVAVGGPRAARRHSIEEILQRCNADKIMFGDERFDESREEETHITFGRRWRSLKQIHLGSNEAVAVLELDDEVAEDLRSYKLHPALLDLATSANTYRSNDQVGGRVYVPLWYKSLTVRAPLSRKLYSIIKQKGQAESPGETIVRDIVIVDEDGTELVAIEDFTLKRVPDHLISHAKSLTGHSAQVSTDVMSDSAGSSGSHATDENSYRSAGYGLSSAVAVEAFAEILSSDRPQVIVSTLPLIERIAEMSSLKGTRVVEAVRASSGSISMHPRPALASAYVAPRNETEEMIAGIWQERLGIERVGIHDSFFELGGNSLNGIDVVAELSKAAGVEVSVVSLYEGPTVSSLAALFNGNGSHKSRVSERQSRGERRRSRMEQRTHASESVQRAVRNS
jgi:acyl transferase domain-containing protein